MDNIQELAEIQQNETVAETLRRLSLLTPIDYDRVREEESERLRIRVATLDRQVENERRAMPSNDAGPLSMFPVVDPWDQPVDGETLLDEIHTAIRTYIVCNENVSIAATLWIAFTWFIDHAQVAPLAVITAPERRCGKSQLLSIMWRLTYRPLTASNISSAAIFRVIDAHSPTLLIDEADSFLRENEEARGILNSGHTRQSAFVIRLVGDNHEPRQFRTFGAKAIAGIGALSETLMDRAIVLELRRKLPEETVESLRHADASHFVRLSSMLARYASDAGASIPQARPDIPVSLNDRAKDNWEPLLAIADHAGGRWPEMARNAALMISGQEQETMSMSAELLHDIYEVFQAWPHDQISTSELLNELTADELKPWATYNRGKPMTPRQLANRLKEYGITPTTIRQPWGTKKGYRRTRFEDVFARYLPVLSVTASQDEAETEITALSDVTDTSGCDGTENP